MVHNHSANNFCTNDLTSPWSDPDSNTNGRALFFLLCPQFVLFFVFRSRNVVFFVFGTKFVDPSETSHPPCRGDRRARGTAGKRARLQVSPQIFILSPAGRGFRNEPKPGTWYNIRAPNLYLQGDGATFFEDGATHTEDEMRPIFVPVKSVPISGSSRKVPFAARLTPTHPLLGTCKMLECNALGTFGIPIS